MGELVPSGNYKERSTFSSKAMLVLGAGALVVSGAVYAAEEGWLDFLDIEILNTTNEVSGSGHIVGVNVYPPSPELMTYTQSGYSRVEDENLGPFDNPDATEISINKISLMFDAEYRPAIEKISDEKNGPHIKVYAFGSPTGGFNYNNVYTVPYKPEVCRLLDNDSGRPEFRDCTDPDDPAYRGSTDIQSSNGGWFYLNGTIMGDVMRYSDIFRRNNWCFLSYMLGGGYEGKSSDEATGDRLLLQARVVAIIRATYRISVAEQLNVPVSIVKMPEDLELMSGAKTVILSDGIEYEVVNNMLYPVTPSFSEASGDSSKWLSKFIVVDQPPTYEIIRLGGELSSVRYPDGLSNDEQAMDHPINRTCVPGSEHAEQEFKDLLDMAVRFGGVNVEPGLWADGHVDFKAAEARIQELIDTGEYKNE